MAHGHPAHAPIGTYFLNRQSLYEAGVHRDVRRGICGSATPGHGAESIVLSGGYKDDVDLGAVVYYTGQGSRNKSGELIADQQMTGLNRSLAKNVDTREPVRLVRAVAGRYRYDGLYSVDDAWMTPGLSGYLVCRYKLAALPSPSDAQAAEGTVKVAAPADRRLVTQYRMVRDQDVPQRVKKLYDFCCQVCGVRLGTAGGVYAEGAHLVPLGYGHAGVDHESNVLCLCPNHHVLVDHGGIAFTDDWQVIDRSGEIIGRLTVHRDHSLDPAHAAAHRKLMGWS